MDDLGFIPDHQIRTALVRAMTREKRASSSSFHAANHAANHSNSNSNTRRGSSTSAPVSSPSVPLPISPVAVWSFNDWSTLQRANPTVLLRSMIKPLLNISGNNSGSSARSGNSSSNSHHGPAT